MGTRKIKQPPLFLMADDLPVAPTTPFFHKLAQVLEQLGFDEFVERTCAPFYIAGQGRPSLPPGVYFRMLLLGYLMGCDSERRIALQACDSLSLRAFLGYELHESTPDHSTLARTRQRISLEAHVAVFEWVLEQLRAAGLARGQQIAVDATTLQANAALKSLRRKDSGASYLGFVKGLARAAGESVDSIEELLLFDQKRKGKTLSNEEWESPADPDARVAKMKGGTTDLAYKAEHAVDLDSGALVAVTVQKADLGDPQSLPKTLAAVEAGASAAEGGAGQGLSQRRDAGAGRGDGCGVVRAGAATAAAQLEGQAGGAAAVRAESGAGGQLAGQGAGEAADGEGRAVDGPHVRDGEAAAGLAAGARECGEAGADPRVRP